MQARNPILRGVICVLLSGLLGGCAPPPAEPPKRIILIVIDTLRRDHLSPYGADIPTPNIQRLAEAGQVFGNVTSSYHQTTMSMGALFTGRTPSVESADPTKSLPWTGRHWCGMARFLAGPDDTCVPQGLLTLAEQMHDAGYWTIGIVSNRLLFRPAGYDQGFDSWIEVGAERADLPRPILSQLRSGKHVYAALDRATRNLPDGPLFLYLHYMDVHDWALNFASYADSVVEQDKEIGRALEFLEAKGLLEDAVVVLTSDHGEILDERHSGFLSMSHFGNPSFQPVLEIPFIASPARFEGTDRFLRGQDLAALMLELAGASPVADATPVLEPDELFLSERLYLTYRKGRFKSTLHRNKLRKWALYDLEADPQEQTNLMSDQKERGRAHYERARDLATALATDRDDGAEMTEEDEQRLRALGYLE